MMPVTVVNPAQKVNVESTQDVSSPQVPHLGPHPKILTGATHLFRAAYKPLLNLAMHKHYSVGYPMCTICPTVSPSAWHGSQILNGWLVARPKHTHIPRHD